MSGWAIDGSGTSGDARRLAYCISGGRSGVVRPSDLKVVPLAVPGNGVRVLTGGGFVLSAYGSAGNESYQLGVSSERQLATVPTGSSATRSDLIVQRVKDPWAVNSTWPVPTDPSTYDGFPVEVIQGVPAGCTARTLSEVPGYAGHTGLVLARIDFPKSTATVTSAMITDLRQCVTPVLDATVSAYQLSSSGTPDKIQAQSPSMETWPAQVETAGKLWVDIPADAVSASITMSISQAVCPGTANAWGLFQFQLAGTANASNVKSQPTRWHGEKSATPSRIVVRLADTIPIPKALRGTRQQLYPRACRESGTVDQGLYADQYTNIDFSIQWLSRPE